jgi:hypothetical protein
LDKVIDNIQLKHVEYVQPIVPIIKPTQLIIALIELSEFIQNVVELVQIENQ